MGLFRCLRHSSPTLQEGINRGCLFLFSLVVMLALHRHFWQDGSDPNKCDALLGRGRWLDKAFQNWQPSGCMMHKFQENDLVTCLQGRKAVFIGDSTSRQLFWATATKMGFKDSGEHRHADISISHRDVDVSFIWDPYLNSSILYRELAGASITADVGNATGTTAILFIGGGLWHARHLGEAYLRRFGESIQDISQAVTMGDQRSLGNRIDRSNYGALDARSLVITAPVPIPRYASLTPPRARTLTPERINALNLHLERASMGRRLPLALSFALMTAGQEEVYLSDGLHVTKEVASSMADLLLSMRCDYLLRRVQSKRYPVDKTCCNSYEPPNWTQALILNVSMGLIPVIFLVAVKDFKRHSFLPSRKILHAIMVLALAMCYCYYADRTQLFNKSRKQYKTTEFMTFCTAIFVLGILSVRRSAVAPHEVSSMQSPQVKDQPFLSRQQTDEWKGWMQLVILTYHYTGASKILWIYQIVRLLVASYLFMSGFGHTLFFYKQAEYSLRRCAAVLIRINLLSCILPYMMQTDYLFYYFAPLISFWYIVIYFTMAIGRTRNESSAFVVGKVIASAAVVTALTRIPGVFETLFYFLEKACNIHWDVAEWRFRLQLDGYIVYIGMLCATAYMKINNALHLGSSEKTTFERSLKQYFQRGRFILGAISILVFPTFFILTHQTSSKQMYNSWVPYISMIPIMSFIILRNFTSTARNLYSSVFAWVGKHSLETFTLQFHIWLAADTKGLLALGALEKATGDTVDGRWLDMAVLTIIFLWVCWHVARATQTLTNWIIDPQERRELIDLNRESFDVGLDLPRNKTKEKLTSTISVNHVADSIRAGSLKWIRGARKLLARNLRVRLAVIVSIVWLLNVLGS